jgi:hypothetical protein
MTTRDLIDTEGQQLAMIWQWYLARFRGWRTARRNRRRRTRR